VEQVAMKPIVHRNSDHSSDAFENLAEFRDLGLLCDIVLCVEDKEIPAHRVILASASPYFRSMFLGKLAESSQDRVVLYEIDGVSVDLLVRYAYSGFVEINELNVQGLLYASALLQFDKVNSACCAFLRKTLDVSNCLGIRSLAESLSCYELFQEAHQFVVDHFTEVLKQGEFLFQPFESLRSLLDCEFLNASSEEEILDGVLEWLNFSPLQRQSNAPSLIKRSCLMNVSPDFLSNKILKDSILQSNSECRQMVSEALDAKKSSNTRDGYKFNGIPLRSHRTGREIILALGGESEGVILSRCQCLSLDSNSWGWDIPGRVEESTTLADMNNGRTFMAVASNGCHAYVAGGRSSWKVLDCAERYEWPGNQWHQLSSLHVARMGAGATVVDNQPIVMGGCDEVAGYLSSVEMYDPLIDNWTFITPMRSKRSYLGAVEIAGSVYAIGGFGEELGNLDGWLTSVERLEAQRGIWLPASPLLQPRAYFGAVQKDGSIYALGGYNSSWLNTAERFDPREGKWYSIQPMRSPRSSAGASTMGSYLYVAGGFNGARNLNSAESYDIRAGKWIKVPPLQNTRYGMALAVLKM